jgi:hypothetical protein
MLSQTSGATVECTGRDVKDRIKKTRRRVADEVDDPPRLECTCPKPPDRPIYRGRDRGLRVRGYTKGVLG